VVAGEDIVEIEELREARSKIYHDLFVFINIVRHAVRELSRSTPA
jgi:hypothetical protein